MCDVRATRDDHVPEHQYAGASRLGRWRDSRAEGHVPAGVAPWIEAQLIVVQTLTQLGRGVIVDAEAGSSSVSRIGRPRARLDAREQVHSGY